MVVGENHLESMYHIVCFDAKSPTPKSIADLKSVVAIAHVPDLENEKLAYLIVLDQEFILYRSKPVAAITSRSMEIDEPTHFSSIVQLFPESQMERKSSNVKSMSSKILRLLDQPSHVAPPVTLLYDAIMKELTPRETISEKKIVTLSEFLDSSAHPVPESKIDIQKIYQNESIPKKESKDVEELVELFTNFFKP